MNFYSLQPKSVIQTTLRDDAASLLENMFREYQLGFTGPNLYVLNSDRPILDPDKKYVVIKKDSRGQEDFEDYRFGTIPKGIRLEDTGGNVIIDNLFIMSRRIKTFPDVPALGRKILADMALAHIHSLLQYRVTPELHAAIFGRVMEKGDSYLATSPSLVLQETLAPDTPPKLIKKFMDWLRPNLLQIERSLGDYLWDIYKVEFSSQGLAIYSLGDFRIWDWHQIKEREAEERKERLENGEASEAI